MAYYSLYHMNPASGHIDCVQQFDAADDAAAGAEARNFQDEKAVELWQEGRKVLRLEGRPRMFQPAQRPMTETAAAG